jgi:hypothetical protein
MVIVLLPENADLGAGSCNNPEGDRERGSGGDGERSDSQAKYHQFYDRPHAFRRSMPGLGRHPDCPDSGHE